MPATTEGFGDSADVVAAVAAQAALALAVFVDGPEQAERTGLVGKFMTDVRLKVRWAVGGKSVSSAGVSVLWIVPPNPR